MQCKELHIKPADATIEGRDHSSGVVRLLPDDKFANGMEGLLYKVTQPFLRWWLKR